MKCIVRLKKDKTFISHSEKPLLFSNIPEWRKEAIGKIRTFMFSKSFSVSFF